MKASLLLVLFSVNFKDFKKLVNIFAQNEIITFATSSTFQDYQFLFNLPNTKIIRNFKQYPKISFKKEESDVYVIIDSNKKNFNNTVRNLLYENNLKVDGKYLVIIATFKFVELEIFFSILWEYGVYNVVIKSGASFYTFFNENCQDIIIKRIALIDSFLKTHPNFFNCSFNVDWSRSSIMVKNPFHNYDPGIFVLQLNELSKRIGIHFQYSQKNANFTQNIAKNPDYDIVGAMIQKKIDISVGPYGYFLNRIANKVRFSVPLAPLEYFLMLPPRKLKPKWKTLLRFDNITIGLILLVIITTGLLLSLMMQISLLRSFLLSFQSFIQLNASLYPRKFTQRSFLLIMLWFATFMYFFYTSSLSGAFTRPYSEPPMKRKRLCR